MSNQKKITKVAIFLPNFNIPNLTDNLVEQINRNIHFSHELFVLDNGSDIDKRSKYATHILEKNIGLNGAIDYMWNIAKSDESFDAYWFLCNDIVLDENRDYLQEMAELFEKLSIDFSVASITPSYHTNKDEVAPRNMKKEKNSIGWRAAVWTEWNAILISKEFMLSFFPDGLKLETKHGFQDVITNFIGWKNNYGSFVMDNLSIRHIGNQTFLQHGGKTINGVLVPNYRGLIETLINDMKIMQEKFKEKGIDIISEREKLHEDIDILKKYKFYLIDKTIPPRNIIDKIKIVIYKIISKYA